MDNIWIEKKWQEDSLIELKISANSEFVTAYQDCYIQDCALDEISKKIGMYIVEKGESPCYLEFGHKEGNYTPAFSMNIFPKDSSGHVKIEVDMEINDNDLRAHRCCFYVNSELGLIEAFGSSLRRLITGEVGEEVALLK